MNASQVVIAAFSEEQAAKITGVSKRQLGYWDRTDFYKPSYGADNRRAAFSRVYSFKDIVALRVLNVLRNECRVPLGVLRDVSQRLGGLDGGPERWTKVRLYAVNGRVVWHEEGTELPQDVVTGQFVVEVVLANVIEAMKQAAEKVRFERDKTKVGSIQKSRHILRNAAVIAGTRIPVAAIKRFHDAGYSTQQIIREYPDLKEEDIAAAIEYRERSSAA